MTPEIYLVHRGNAYALDEDGRFLQYTSLNEDGTVQADEWGAVDHHMLPDDTNAALGLIRQALLTVPQEVPAP